MNLQHTILGEVKMTVSNLTYREVYCLLGCNAVWYDRRLLMFTRPYCSPLRARIVSHASSGRQCLWTFTRLHGITSQIILIILTTIRFSDLTYHNVIKKNYVRQIRPSKEVALQHRKRHSQNIMWYGCILHFLNMFSILKNSVL
jgi:hypothetical protein